jgi:energy-coupling factor transport system permease protein
MTMTMGPSLVPARGTSWLHRLDPVAKIVWLVAVVVIAFATYHPVPLLTMAAVAFALGVTAGVGARVARILLIFAPVTASILVIQSLAPAGCQGACTPFAHVGPFALYQEGTIHGLSLVGRLLAVEAVALAVITTTHPSDLFAGLARLRVPYLANLILSMTLQLIPILQREFALVLAAQRARGMRSTGFQAVLPSFVPVFAGAFERVRQLTIGLESRAFGATGIRTSYRRVRSGRGGAAAAITGVAAGFLGTAVALTTWTAERTPEVLFSPEVVGAVFVLAGTLFVGVVLAGIRSVARA